MKKLIFTLLLGAPALAPAQNMSEQDMQNMMASMQEMQACMQSIDQQALKQLEKDSQALEAEIDQLCQSGKRDEAQQRALDYSRKMMQEPSVMQLRDCTEKMQDAMKGMLPEQQPVFENLEEELKDKHICDME